MKAGITIDLLRHGETEGGNRFRGSTDDPLTSTGWEQLNAAVERSNRNWDCIITSPLQRCAAFAESVAQQYQRPITYDERFQEMHFGEWEGRSAAELFETDPDALTRFWEDPLHNTAPAGEALTDFQSRVLEAWQELVNGHTAKRVLLVTHGGVIRVLLCDLLKRPLSNLLSFEVKHASLHELQLDRHGDPLSNSIVERNA